jgi:hypothetical protein
MFLGFADDFRFNPSYRNSIRILFKCPKCGSLNNYHTYSSLDLLKVKDKKERLRKIRWERKFFYWRDRNDKKVL